MDASAQDVWPLLVYGLSMFVMGGIAGLYVLGPLSRRLVRRRPPRRSESVPADEARA